MSAKKLQKAAKKAVEETESLEAKICRAAEKALEEIDPLRVTKQIMKALEEKAREGERVVPAPKVKAPPKISPKGPKISVGEITVLVDGKPIPVRVTKGK